MQKDEKTRNSQERHGTTQNKWKPTELPSFVGDQ